MRFEHKMGRINKQAHLFHRYCCARGLKGSAVVSADKGATVRAGHWSVAAAEYVQLPKIDDISF